MSEYVENKDESISGVVSGVTFHNPTSGFTVFDLENGDEGLVTVVGVFPDVAVGENVSLSGHWDFHASFGRQFRADSLTRHMPETAADMLRYLSSGAVSGIGAATAKRIVERFGEKSFEVLENQPELLVSIKGISADRAKRLSAAFKKQVASRQVIIYLERYGLTATECMNAYKALGAEAASRISENPYVLCTEGVGMSFERAEAISQNLPTPPADVYRIKAGIIHVVRHNLHNGHTCLPRNKLIKTSSEMLNCSEGDIDIAIDSLTSEKQLCVELINKREFIFLPQIWLAEKKIAQRISVMLRFPPAGHETLERDIKLIEANSGISYEGKQRQAIETAVKQGLLILTGGPGTGKTTTVNGILELFKKDGLEVALTAPTGRAAKRMSDITGRPAKTIHRLLEVEWGDGDKAEFSRDMQNPLDVDAVIVDELSMVDVTVFSALLDALPLGCRLIMVGDSDQLPPVGAGNVLADLIASGLLPVVALTEVFRQAMESLIVMNAHRIVGGEMPVLDRTDSDCFFMNRPNPTACAATVVELCTKRLPAAYGYDPFNDIQVLCPSRKGELGTMNLNRGLQAVLNPPDRTKDEFNRAGTVFRTGDKVMQIKNNYDIVWSRGGDEGTGVFNGDIGLLTEINTKGSYMKIQFDDRLATYPFENTAELELAYACTVHKSQGSEFEAVVLPLCHTVPQLSYRNLLYTAVTRAKSKLVIVGTQGQVKDMVDNDKKTRRYSALTHFLNQQL